MTDTSTPNKPRASILGEELPIFCEKCGYALVGLPQQVCGTCDIRQFHCPECGHHQPINTLRPAFQKVLGRIRAGWLTVVVFLKLIFFGGQLCLGCLLGGEFSYSYQQAYGYSRGPYIMNYETLFGFCIFGWLFGFVGRLLLLRWKNGAVVGLVLGILTAAAISLGAKLTEMQDFIRSQRISLLNDDFINLIGFSASMVVLGAAAAWSIWRLLVNAFLPRRTAASLLEWQHNLSVKHVAVISKSE